MNSQEVIQSITDRIIDLFKVKVNFWKYTWNCSSDQHGIPSNPRTQEDYRGINVPILWNAADIAATRLTCGLVLLRLGKYGWEGEEGREGHL